MPRITPGATTQAAAQKVAESDKPPMPKHTSEDFVSESEIKEGPPWELSEEELAKLPQTEQKEEKAATKTRAARKPGVGPEPKQFGDKDDTAPDHDQVSKITSRQRIGIARKAGEPNEFVFQSLDEQDDWTVLTLYGPAGTRKTTSLCRMTMVRDTGRLLIIAAESGLKKQALQRHGVDTARVVFWPPRGTRITYDGLEALFYQILADLEKEPGSWLGIGWDSLTEVIQMLVDNAAQADIDRMAEIARKANKPLDMRKLYEREGADYQVATGQFRQLLRKYRTLPCHQVFIALEEDRKETVETDEGRKQKVGVIGPALTPMVRMDVEQHSDVIIRLSVADVAGVGSVGVGRSTPAEDLRAKDRYGVLPLQMIDPGFERIWAYITGALKEETDGAQQADVGTATEAPSEAQARQEAEREAAKQKRQAARAETPPKAPTRRSSAKVTAESGTPDNPPM
jgi:hypothetical protein